MAFRQAGMRRIVVDGVEYFWKIPRDRHVDWDLQGGFAALVQIPKQSGSVLFIRFPQHHPSVAPAVGKPVVSVVPSQVAAAIRRAVAAGWRADQPGPAFVWG